MLLISGLKDELNETEAELGIEWKVADFFSLSQEAGCYYQSAPFTFGKSSWNLQLFPGGDNIQNAPSTYISVYLRGCNFAELPSTVSYSLGMKKADGTVEKIVDKKHSFDEKDSVSGQEKFYQSSEILRRKAELAPTGDLILTCTLKHNTVKTLQVTTHQMTLIDAFSFCCSNSRYFSTSPILKTVPYWRRKHGLPRQARDYGPLTDLPDWSYADGRPAPLTVAAKKKKMLHKEYCEKIIKLTKEVDKCFELNKGKAALEEQKRQHVIQNRLKPKGKAFV